MATWWEFLGYSGYAEAMVDLEAKGYLWGEVAELITLAEIEISISKVTVRVEVTATAGRTQQEQDALRHAAGYWRRRPMGANGAKPHQARSPRVRR